MSGLTWNSIDIDRRLLSGLEASAFDSVAVDLAGRLTDAVIDSAVQAMPSEYDATLADASASSSHTATVCPNRQVASTNCWRRWWTSMPRMPPTARP